MEIFPSLSLHGSALHLASSSVLTSFSSHTLALEEQLLSALPALLLDQPFSGAVNDPCAQKHLSLLTAYFSTILIGVSCLCRLLFSACVMQTYTHIQI